MENLTWATADQYAAGKDLFTYNLVAIRVEAIFGWVLRDKKAFVKIAAKCLTAGRCFPWRRPAGLIDSQTGRRGDDRS